MYKKSIARIAEQPQQRARFRNTIPRRERRPSVNIQSNGLRLLHLYTCVLYVELCSRMDELGELCNGSCLLAVVKKCVAYHSSYLPWIILLHRGSHFFLFFFPYTPRFLSSLLLKCSFIYIQWIFLIYVLFPAMSSTPCVRSLCYCVSRQWRWERRLGEVFGAQWDVGDSKCEEKPRDF